ncbi:MAG: recombinase [Methylococcaceae bacterium]|nr:recombinase [Methylococcaceae bacterium]
MEDYEQYEADCEEIRKENEALLSLFEKHLEQANLSTKTIKNHVDNVNFYINQYLLYYEAIPANKGVFEVGDFLGDWFVRKAMWSTAAQIKKNATSFKKFYAFLLEQQLIQKQDLEELKEIIKEQMNDWLENVNDYNNSFF